MSEIKPINIVGGGLAGLTLGIGLRQRDVPVVIWEQGHYPRHRVCGEFISGRGQETLQKLGLLELLMEHGMLSLNTARFFSRAQGFPIHSLPKPALSVSRFELDHLLASRFKQLGGELQCGTRVPLQRSTREGWVRASGRRPQTGVDSGGWRWFGTKAHATGVPLSADLEMHVRRDGYVGMSKLPGGETNICGLFRRGNGQDSLNFSVPERLRGEPGTVLYDRLAAAKFDVGSCCAVAGLNLRPQRAARLSECCIGDVLTMIPPLTGNGMSMAFESAELAMEPLRAYAEGGGSWEQARKSIGGRCDGAFRARLRWAGWLQEMMFSALVRPWLVPLALNFEPAWKLLFSATR